MRRTHAVPILSARCDGSTCRTCPRPWRFLVTGMELWGHGDNATFFHDATEDYRRKPIEKLSRARWRRVAFRWAAIVIPAFLLLMSGAASLMRGAAGSMETSPPGWASVPWGGLLFTYLGIGAAVGVFFGGQSIAAWCSVREVRKTYILPAGRVLSRAAGVAMKRRDMIASIELPEGFGKESEGDPEPVRVYVPDVVLDQKMKDRIAKAVGARLGLPDPVQKWTESGVPVRFVELLPQALPPKTVTLEDLREELLASDMDHPLVGLMTGGRVSRMDMKNDSPHTLGSAGSGAGKSTLYKLIAMQRLRLGGYAIILDFKKWSHLRWAGRLPAGRVLIEDDVPRIHALLCRVMDELMWRKSFDLEDEAELSKLPVIDVYVEEINTLMGLLITYWKSEVARAKQEARTALRRIKEEAKLSGDLGYYAEEIEEAEEALARAMGLPIVSPAIQALQYGVNLGREFSIHFHFIGQSMSAKAAGGRDTRESFRTRLLARWDAKTWKMLADGIPFVVCPSGDVGIWAHVHDGRAEIVRVPFVPDAFAVEYVLDGVSPSGPMFHGDPVPTIEASARRELPASAPLSTIAGLLPAKRNGERMTLKALRLAAGRDGFPEPIEEPAPGAAALYHVDEVLAWFRDREGIASYGEVRRLESA